MDDSLIHVTTFEQAELMRQIRNTCREFMTNNNGEISPAQQRAWFQSIKDNQDELRIFPFLYEPRRGRGEPLGYGIIRYQGPTGPNLKTEPKWILSGGLLPAWRGKGLGVDLFWELADYVHQAFKATAWLTVWQSNERAWRSYLKAGFVCEPPIICPDGRVMLEMRKDPP